MTEEVCEGWARSREGEGRGERERERWVNEEG